jgi:hypothetical protein
LWNQEDGFFYDVLHMPNGDRWPLRVRSMVGLIPLYAIQTLEPDLLERMPAFRRRLEWFIENRPDLMDNMACMRTTGNSERRMFSIAYREQLERILTRMLDEDEFLSAYGVRGVSKYHEKNPYVLELNGSPHSVDYEPGESRSGLFGGNSNWRGPIWMPVNYLLVQALRRFHEYYGDSLKVECPTRSGKMMNLDEVADELCQRLVNVLRRDHDGKRPVNGAVPRFNDCPYWKDLVVFHEYFHGDTGRGVGANHQTGWTALVASMIHELYYEPQRHAAVAAKLHA